MSKWLSAACVAALGMAAAIFGVVSAQGAAPGVQVSVLSAFPAGAGPASAAATNTGDVVVPAAPGRIVEVGPNGKQTPEAVTLPGGAFGIGPIGIAYDSHHQLYAALPNAFGPPASGAPGVLKISSNGKSYTAVPGSQGMVAADGMGLDSASGFLYVTDIFGGALWRVAPGGGSAAMWTSHATNPLLIGPDGVKVYGNAVYTSDEGRILRIPINPDGTAGTATVWATPGGFTDDMVLDDRTGDVYVTKLDTDELLRITPAGVTTLIASNADGLWGAANMALIHNGQSVVIYLANSGTGQFSGNPTGLGPALLKITIG
jgi:hypothetical protein